MPGKNAKLVKNRPKSKDDNNEDNSSTAGSNSVRSRSPLNQSPRHPTPTEIQPPTPTNTTLSQAGSESKKVNSIKLTPTATANGQAGNAATVTALPPSTVGEDELIVSITNDESFPDEMDTSDTKKSTKRKRETDTTTTTTTTTQALSSSQSAESGPRKRDQSPSTSTNDKWTKVQHKSNSTNSTSFKIPKSSNNLEDLRNKIPKRQQHQQGQQNPSYANIAGRGHPQVPSQMPWGPLELRVYCTNYRQAPMDQQTWSELHLNIMELVQNEVENEEANEEDLKSTEAKKMWWHAKLECGVVEVYSKEALNWFKHSINKLGNRIRAWTWMEKPEPRLKVWIKSQFVHLTAEKYIELCFKYHPLIKNQPWRLESTTNDDGNKRTAYIRATQEILTYLQKDGDQEKFTIKGFCGIMTLATAKEAPEKPQRRPSPTKAAPTKTTSPSKTNTTPATPTSSALTPAMQQALKTTFSSTQIRPAASALPPSLPHLPTMKMANSAPTSSAPSAPTAPLTTAGLKALQPPPSQLPAELKEEIRQLAAQTGESHNPGSMTKPI